MSLARRGLVPVTTILPMCNSPSLQLLQADICPCQAVCLQCDINMQMNANPGQKSFRYSLKRDDECFSIQPLNAAKFELLYTKLISALALHMHTALKLLNGWIIFSPKSQHSFSFKFRRNSHSLFYISPLRENNALGLTLVLFHVKFF